MKALICMFNSKYIHSSLAPWCLRAGIKKYSPDTEAVVLEGTVNEDVNENAHRILSHNADIIGFCCYIWNISYVKRLISVIRRSSNAVIVLGGPEVSYSPEEILRNNEVDFVLSGEGEEAFARLCDYISGKGKITDIKGLSYKKDGEIVVGEPYVSGKEPVSPYCDEYFDTLNGRLAYIETTRGCPFSCGYCLSGRCGKMVFYDMERVKREILMLSQSSARTIKFIDRTFNADEKHANEIISFILDHYGKAIPDGTCFHFEIAADILRDSTLDLLSRLPCGAVQLEIGIQSFNEDTLRAVNRITNLDRLTKNIRKLLSFNNMHIHVDLIAGLPHENLESFKKSFDIAFGLRPDMLQLGFLKLLHGSDLRENGKSFGCVYRDEPPYEVICTDCLSEDDLKTIHCAEDALERMYNSARFRKTLEFVLKTTGASPFEIFSGFGETTYGKGNISLDDYTSLVYNFFRKISDEARLRDCMVCDRLASNSSGVIPDCLKIPDKRLKSIKKHLYENIGRAGGKISCAVLYTENRVVWCNYGSRDRITGNFELSYIETDEFTEKWSVL